MAFNADPAAQLAALLNPQDYQNDDHDSPPFQPKNKRRSNYDDTQDAARVLPNQVESAGSLASLIPPVISTERQIIEEDEQPEQQDIEGTNMGVALETNSPLERMSTAECITPPQHFSHYADEEEEEEHIDVEGAMDEIKRSGMAVGDRLYRSGVVNNLAKHQWAARERLKEQLRRDEVEECTFHPQISRFAVEKYHGRPSDLSPDRRYPQEQRAQAARMAQRRRERILDELQGCTFRPLTLEAAKLSPFVFRQPHYANRNLQRIARGARASASKQRSPSHGSEGSRDASGERSDDIDYWNLRQCDRGGVHEQLYEEAKIRRMWRDQDQAATGVRQQKRQSGSAHRRPTQRNQIQRIVNNIETTAAVNNELTPGGVGSRIAAASGKIQDQKKYTQDDVQKIVERLLQVTTSVEPSDPGGSQKRQKSPADPKPDAQRVHEFVMNVLGETEQQHYGDEAEPVAVKPASNGSSKAQSIAQSLSPAVEEPRRNETSQRPHHHSQGPNSQQRSTYRQPIKNLRTKSQVVEHETPVGQNRTPRGHHERLNAANSLTLRNNRAVESQQRRKTAMESQNSPHPSLSRGAQQQKQQQPLHSSQQRTRQPSPRGISSIPRRSQSTAATIHHVREEDEANAGYLYESIVNIKRHMSMGKSPEKKKNSTGSVERDPSERLTILDIAAYIQLAASTVLGEGHSARHGDSSSSDYSSGDETHRPSGQKRKKPRLVKHTDRILQVLVHHAPSSNDVVITSGQFAQWLLYADEDMAEDVVEQYLRDEAPGQTRLSSGLISLRKLFGSERDSASTRVSSAQPTYHSPAVTVMTATDSVDHHVSVQKSAQRQEHQHRRPEQENHSSPPQIHHSGALEQSLKRRLKSPIVVSQPTRRGGDTQHASPSHPTHVADHIETPADQSHTPRGHHRRLNAENMLTLVNNTVRDPVMDAMPAVSSLPRMAAPQDTHYDAHNDLSVRGTRVDLKRSTQGEGSARFAMEGRMEDHHRNSRLKAERKARQIIKERAEEEMAECSFQPNVHPHYYEAANEGKMTHIHASPERPEEGGDEEIYIYQQQQQQQTNSDVASYLAAQTANRRRLQIPQDEHNKSDIISKIEHELNGSSSLTKDARTRSSAAEGRQAQVDEEKEDDDDEMDMAAETEHAASPPAITSTVPANQLQDMGRILMQRQLQAALLRRDQQQYQ